MTFKKYLTLNLSSYLCIRNDLYVHLSFPRGADLGRVRAFRRTFLLPRQSHNQQGQDLGADSTPKAQNKDRAFRQDWVTKDDEAAREYANLYRDIAIGGDNTVRRVLLSFDVPRKDIDEAISADEYSKEFSLVSLSKEKTEHGPTYSIRFLKTI